MNKRLGRMSFLCLLLMLLMPASMSAKTFKGTINIEVGQEYYVSHGYESNAYTVSGYWTKTDGSAFVITDSYSDNRGCTIKGNQVGTSTLNWWGGVHAGWNVWNDEYYWTVNVVPSSDIQINATNFPDDKFRSFLLSQNYGSDGKLKKSEISSITQIDVRNKNIASLQGIEFFSSLNTLYCSENQLTSLNVSNNRQLEFLSCHDNQLTSLNVSNNSQLEILICDKNQLTSLNLSSNTKLKSLYVDNNKLTVLDVSSNTLLESFECNDNNLTSLDVSNCPNLDYFRCWGNSLASLDLSKNTKLETLHCSNNKIFSLLLPNTTTLKHLYCWTNQLTSLDVSKNVSLEELDCNGNQLTSLDVSKNASLIELQCNGNQLTSLGVSKNTALKGLSCSDNLIETLDVSNNTELTYLNCQLNNIRNANMDALVNSLPLNTSDNARPFRVLDDSYKEKNICTKGQVASVKAKGWKPLIKTHPYEKWEELNVVNITDIILEQTSITLYIGKPDEYLSATVMPDNATYKNRLEWSSNNPEIATIREGEWGGKYVHAQSVGTATLTCKAIDDSGVYSTLEITVIDPVIKVSDITIDRTSLSLHAGQSETLTATVKPDNATDKTVKWTSSNTSVATVSSTGKVTSVAVGSAVITCMANDGSGVTATCEVTVTDPEPVGITISPTSKTIEQGETFTATYTLTPSNATTTVTWSSDNESIATVTQDGIVTGVGVGSTFINVETANGKSAYCKLIVTAPQPTAIALPKNVTVYVGRSLKLTPTLTPEGAETALTWYSDDQSVVRVSADGVLTGVAEGLALVNVTSSNGITSNACKVKVEPDPSGISNVLMDEDSDKPIYTLSGQRLTVPKKGINIIGGKKVIVK